MTDNCFVADWIVATPLRCAVIKRACCSTVFTAEDLCAVDVKAPLYLLFSEGFRPCLMTSTTTVLALIPVLTSVGRGSDVMVPMGIPSFGGMLVVLINIFVVPVFYCALKELRGKSGAESDDSIAT